MEQWKIFQGIIIGSLFTSVLFAIIAYFIVIIDNSVGDFGIKPSDFWWLAVILGFVLGLLFGGLVGSVITILKLNLIKGVLFGLFSSIFAVLLFAVLSGGGWDNVTKNFSIAFIVVGALNGLLVSFITEQLNK